MLNFEQQKQWIFDRHDETNHVYSDQFKLPYTFHLKLAGAVADEFEHLIPVPKIETWKIATFGHDTIEDTRVSYNELKKIIGFEAAEIVFAVTNNKGRTREERANDAYYDGIRALDGAIFVKLCDRIANVRFGQLTKTDMFYKYAMEQEKFAKKISKFDGNGKILFEPMFIELEKSFKNI